jgi:hypothetical protein
MPFDAWSKFDGTAINGHTLLVITSIVEKTTDAVEEIALCVPGHYLDPNSISHTLERLGKAAAAQKLRLKFPQTVKTRSGDLGEILATEYIEKHTQFSVPIKKLRWHDHREMAMRGDDVIGFKLNDGRPFFFKDRG